VSCHRCACFQLLTGRGEHQRNGIITLFRAILMCAVLPIAWTQPGNAQDTIERPVTIYVAGTAGGGIDLYARLVGRHIARHIPGNPVVTVQVMPGAGGIRAANYLAAQAPRDGTAMTTFAGGPILEPLIGARNPGYDMSRFTWIGAITKDIGLCIAWGATPFKTIDDVKKKQMVVAGTGAGSETDTSRRAQRRARHQVQAGERLCRVSGNDPGYRTRRGGWPLRIPLLRAQDRQARLAARQEDQRAPADGA
jgi:hypothetical protein